METRQKMVLVWGTEDILSTSIQHMLATSKDWKVVNIIDSQHLRDLIHNSESKDIDIVIIRPVDREGFADLPLQLLQDHANIRLITISLESNIITIYNQQKKLVKETSDLIMAIERQV
jgi:hypothetical protein